MYFIFVSTDRPAVELLEKVLHGMDQQKTLLSVSNGYDLIHFLQNIKRGESYPDLIILSVKMARLGGMELLALLKSDDMYCLIPVLMLLKEGDTVEEVSCQRFGTETMIYPGQRKEWLEAAKRMCTICG